MIDASKMSVGEYQARQIEQAARILSCAVEGMPEDRLRWRPATDEASKTRSVMDQVDECVEANLRILGYLRATEVPPRPSTFDTFPTLAEALVALRESADLLAEEVRKIEGEALMREVRTHRGAMLAAVAIQFPVRNMIYHTGQISMIQLLYGDTDLHIDASYTTL